MLHVPAFDLTAGVCSHKEFGVFGGFEGGEGLACAVFYVQGEEWLFGDFLKVPEAEFLISSARNKDALIVEDLHTVDGLLLFYGVLAWLDQTGRVFIVEAVLDRTGIEVPPVESTVMASSEEDTGTSAVTRSAGDAATANLIVIDHGHDIVLVRLFLNSGLGVGDGPVSVPLNSYHIL